MTVKTKLIATDIQQALAHFGFGDADAVDLGRDAALRFA